MSCSDSTVLSHGLYLTMSGDESLPGRARVRWIDKQRGRLRRRFSTPASSAASHWRTFTLHSPCDGILVPLHTLKDPLFATGSMGVGIAIEPTSQTLVAPFDGQIISSYHTEHSLVLVSECGLQLLLHVGLDTVDLKGKGFTPLVACHDWVKKGQPLLTWDRERIKHYGYPLTTPIIVLYPKGLHFYPSHTGVIHSLEVIGTVSREES